MSDPTDITGKAVGRLLDQFSESPKFLALCAAYLDRLQDLEDAAYPLLAERSVDNATGHRLDGIGQIFKVARGGRSDTVYRKALKIEQLILQSDGTGDEILALALALLETASGDYDFLEYFPKTLYLRPVDHILVQDPVFVASSLRRAVSAATQLLFVYAYTLDAITFTLSSQAAASESSTSLGLAPDPTTIANWHYESLGYTLSGLLASEFRFNNPIPTNATELYIHDSPTGGGDQSATLATLANDFLWIDGPNGDFYVYVSAVTDNTGTFTLDVIVPATAGATVDYDNMAFKYCATGGRFAGAA